MTETTENPTPAEISQTPLATKTNTTNTNKDTLSAPPKSSKTFGYIAITISCAAIAASAWTFYQQQQQHQLLTPLAVQLQSLQQTQQQLNQAVDSQAKASALIPRLQTAIDSQTSKSQQLSNTLDAQQQAFIKQDAGLQSINQQLSRLSNTTKEDWKLAEAEYLIRLANQRLLMESDINGAQNLLQTADQILADMADPILFDTRKAIAKDIQALKATTSFDLEGLYLQLDALNKQVESLPQTEPSADWQNAGAQVADEASTTTASNIFQSTMIELWHSLRSLIVINYQHKPIKALLPAADYQELVSSLKLQINVAQLALLKKESTIYQTALSHVAEAISIHFDLESQTTIACMSSITALQQIDPSPELPLPRQSLTQMKKLMRQWNALHTEVSTSAAAQSPTTNEATESDNVPAPAQAPTEPSPTPAPAKPLEPNDTTPASTNEDEVAA